MKLRITPLVLAASRLVACGSPDCPATTCAPGRHVDDDTCTCVSDSYDAAPEGEGRYAVQMPIPDPSLIKDALDNGATWHASEGLLVGGDVKFPLLVGDEWFLDVSGSTISERVTQIISEGTITPGDADPNEGPAPFTVQWNGMIFALRDVGGAATLTDP